MAFLTHKELKITCQGWLKFLKLKENEINSETKLQCFHICFSNFALWYKNIWAYVFFTQ